MSSQAGSAPSALSGTLGEMIGEFFGTMILILFGDGVVATFVLFNKVASRTRLRTNGLSSSLDGVLPLCWVFMLRVQLVVPTSIQP